MITVGGAAKIKKKLKEKRKWFREAEENVENKEYKRKEKKVRRRSQKWWVSFRENVGFLFSMVQNVASDKEVVTVNM